MQNVSDGGRARTRVAVVIDNVRKQAGDAGSFRALYKDVAVIAITADRREDYRDSLAEKVSAHRDSRRVVIDAADCHIAGEIDPARDRLLKPKRNCGDLGFGDALTLKITASLRSQQYTW